MLPPRSEAARRRGVARATLRTQLHAAYGKLGGNGRDELVHLLASYGFRETENGRPPAWLFACRNYDRNLTF
jgi:hypothetical protein